MAIHGTLKSSVVASGAGGTDQQAVTGKGFLYGFIISQTAGAVELWDNTSAATTQLSAGNALAMYAIDPPVPFNIGVFVVMAANQTVTVLYQTAP